MEFLSQMDPALMAAAVITLMVAAVGMLLAGRDDGRQRARRRLKVEVKAQPSVERLSGRQGVADRVAARAGGFLARTNPADLKRLRAMLVRAGYFSPNAVGLFFLARIIATATLALSTLVALNAWTPGLAPLTLWSFVLSGALAGYLAPGFLVARRAKRVLQENRLGFPDFMDLMGVCANAGLSMEAGLERVSRELADMYPVLGVHLQILCLEVRAGRPIEAALHAMADRMDIPEVRAFATLLQQSKELGSSLSDALRVFSDDMRHKRLSMAEEKAYALPAKLSVPVTACILPVVLFVAILPVIVRFNTGIH